MTRALRALWILSVLAVACASQKLGRTNLPDGSFKLDCRKSLAECLTDLTKDICQEYGYEVFQGKEIVRRYGVEPVNSVIVTSEAVVRCRSSGALFSDAPKAAPPPASAQHAAKPRCFPGATQACLGPGACKGAQTCRADGASFGTCDCGVAAAPPETAPAAPAPSSPPPPATTPSLDGGTTP